MTAQLLHPLARRALAVVAFVAFVTAPFAASAKIRVVATLTDLAAVARAVGGPDVEVTALVPPDADAHYVDARPSLMLPLARADLLIVNGLQLEVGWLPPLLRNCRNPKVQGGTAGYLNASVFVKRMQVPVGQVSRVMGDVHPGGNPHYTHDPRTALTIARAITERYAAIDPPRAKAYNARLAAFTKRLKVVIAAQRARFAKIPARSRSVVAYHRSLVYLLDWLQIGEIANVEPRPGIPPNPGHTAKVLGRMRATGTKVIVTEPYYPQAVSNTLARLVKGSVARIPGGTNFAKGETYLQRIKRTTDVLHAALIKAVPATKPTK